MSGVALTTISPSSTSSRRSTPCVEGCCGPIEIVICESSGRSTTSNCGGMLAVETLISVAFVRCPMSHASHATDRTLETYRTRLISGCTVRILATENPFAARALPIVRKKDAPQVRMSVENHAE